MVRQAYTLREDDDDWSQARALVMEVMDDEQRTRFVSNVSGHLADGVSEPVLKRAFEYWRNVDQSIGERIEKEVRDQIGGESKAPGMMSAKSITTREDVPMPGELDAHAEANKASHELSLEKLCKRHGFMLTFQPR